MGLNLWFSAPALLVVACNGNHSFPSQTAIDQLQLKKGAIIVCGTPDKEFGVVNFDIDGSREVKNDFNTAVELLHSFEYDEAEKAFAKIAAFRAYQVVLEKCPNRFNSLFGCGRASEILGDTANAALYYKQLLAIADQGSSRPELNTARMFLSKRQL